MKYKRTPEQVIQKTIIDFLTQLENAGELFFQRTNNIAVYDPTTKRFRSLPKGQKKGFPDITVILKGKFIGLELKQEKGYLSKEQKTTRDSIIKNGGEYHTIRSLRDLKNALRSKMDVDKYDLRLFDGR